MSGINDRLSGIYDRLSDLAGGIGRLNDRISGLIGFLSRLNRSGAADFDVLAGVADAVIKVSRVHLNERRVCNGDNAVAVGVRRDLLIGSGLDQLSRDHLDNGRVGNVDLAVEIGVADEDISVLTGSGGLLGRLLGCVGGLLCRLGRGLSCFSRLLSRFGWRLSGLYSRIGRLLALGAVEIYDVDNAGNIVAACIAGNDNIRSAGERLCGIGARLGDLVGVDNDIIRQLLAGFEVNVAGDDLGLEGGRAVLDPNFAGCEIAVSALRRFLSGVGGTVAVVEHNAGHWHVDGALVPTVAFRGHHACLIPFAVRRLDDGAFGVVGVASDSRPAGGFLVVNDSRGVVERLVHKIESEVAAEGALGLAGELGHVELIALDLRGNSAVFHADLITGGNGILERLAVLIDKIRSDVAGADAGTSVGEGNGVIAVCLDDAAGSALGLDEVVIVEDIAVGNSAIGVACSVLRGLGEQNLAVFINVVDGQLAEALGHLEVAEARAVNENHAALGRNGNSVAGNRAEALDACALVGGSNDRPVGAAERDVVRLGTAVDENRQLVPLAGLAVGIGIGYHIAVVGLEGRLDDAGAMQRRIILADLEHTLVVSCQTGERLDAVPVDRIDGVAGVVGVVVALLGTTEIGTCGHERDTLRGHQQRHDFLDLVLIARGRAHVGGGTVTLDDLIPEDQVIVRVGIAYRLRGTLGSGSLVGLSLNTENDVADIRGGVALYKALADAVGVTLDRVAVLVAECAYTRVQTADTGTLPAVDRVGVRGGAAGPGLAVHEDLGAVGHLGVQIGADLIHGFDVVQTHEVETEAINVILVCPILGGFDHELTEHQLVGSGLVAAAGTVGENAAAAHSVIIAGSGFLEAGAGREGVVVNNVHDDGDASVVECLHHLLEFLDSDVTVVGIRGVGAFGSVVVFGIVTPVTVGGGGSDGLVNGAEVVNRLQLDAVDACFYQIIGAGGDVACLAVEGGAAFCKGEIGTLVLSADAGVLVDGEVAHMYFPDDCLAGVLEDNMLVGAPAFGVGGVEVNDHGALAVDADRLGIDVLGFVCLALAGDNIGVVLVLVVAGEGVGPYTGAGVFGHVVGTDDTGAGFTVGTGLVDLDFYIRRIRRPCLEYGLGRTVGAAEILFVVCRAGVVFQISLVIVSADCLLRACLCRAGGDRGGACEHQ